MDIFNTVVSAIDLTEKIWKAIDDFQKVPERMRRLQFDIKSLQQMMYKLKEIQYRSKDQEALITVEVEEIEKTLKDLQNKINRQKQKPSSSMLSRSFRTFKSQLKFDDMDEVAEELQKRKASLSLTINMLVLRSVDNVDQKMQQHATATTAATKEAEKNDQRQTKPTEKEVPHISRKDFLDYLNAPNYAEDELRVKSPAEGTAMWIYEKVEYQRWKAADGLSSLHLVGKMGSGKSVLTKNIMKDLKREQADNSVENSAVLYYFCSCVNRTDNPSSILKGFISQFALEHEHIYDNITGSNELLQSRRSGDNTGWSFEALWHIFSRMVQCSGLTSLYCVVDALDECDSKSLEEFLDLLHKMAKDCLTPSTIKLLFSSREYTHILESLNSSGSTLRLFIDPESVTSDIRVAMQSDIKNIQRRLKLEDDEVGILQESILKKSDGMFLWVSLAAKDIMENSYDVTFETLEELVEDLPEGLKGLYEKNWVKLVDSLPNAKLALANRVLTWVLLAKRPLTISELTLALAISPGQKNTPPPTKLLRNLEGFVLNYLAPFIEILSSNPEEVPSTPDESGENPAPTYKSSDNSKVRLVHQSAQEYLLEACKMTNSRLEINLREGHEAIARTCLTYMCCEELQLGWIDENLSPLGVFITTDETRAKVEARLNQFPLLGYASVNWAFHVRKCQYLSKDKEEKEEDDVFSQAINFVERFPKGYACSAQCRQFLRQWEADTHYSPAPPLHCFSGKDMMLVVKRLLRTPEKYVSVRDLENCTALHYPALSDESEEHPEERGEIIQILLEAGVDPNEANLLGNTPLCDAASFPLPEVVNILLKWGAEVNTKNKDGQSPLNDSTALGSKEIVEALLDAGADIESTDLEGLTPLLTAVQAGLWGAVRTLVARGCNVNAQSSLGWSSLHYATERADIVRLLLEKGADVNIRSKTGFSPLHDAARFNHKESFDIMCEHGADIQIKSDTGYSLLHAAAVGDSVEIFKTILESVKDINHADSDGWTSLCHAAKRGGLDITKLLVEKGADIKAAEQTGFTPLHLAIEAGSNSVVRFYLEIWDDIEIITKTWLTPLCLACTAPGGTTNPEIVEWLLENGADPNRSGEQSGMTPLQVASCDGFTAAVEVLLKHGVNIEDAAGGRVRPFTFACKQGKLETAKFLLSKGALIDSGRSSGSTDLTPLELTCFNGHLEVVKWLIEEGAETAHVTFSPMISYNEMTPVHNDIFRLLMENGGDVDQIDNTSNTPFHAALKEGNLEFAKLILEYNPDLSKRDSRGHTGYHSALYENNKDFLDLVFKNRDPAVFSSLLDGYGETCGQVAATNGYLESLKFLTGICPKESLRISSVRDLWSILTEENTKPIVEILHNIGALDIDIAKMNKLEDVEFRSGSNWIVNSFEDSVEVLNKLGMQWNIKDRVGQTILHSVASRMLAFQAKKLLQLGAGVDIRDFNFMTPFDILVEVAIGNVLPWPRPSGGLLSRGIPPPPSRFPPPPRPHNIPPYPSQLGRQELLTLPPPSYRQPSPPFITSPHTSSMQILPPPPPNYTPAPILGKSVLPQVSPQTQLIDTSKECTERVSTNEPPIVIPSLEKTGDETKLSSQSNHPHSPANEIKFSLPLNTRNPTLCSPSKVILPPLSPNLTANMQLIHPPLEFERLQDASRRTTDQTPSSTASSGSRSRSGSVSGSGSPVLLTILPNEEQAAEVAAKAFALSPISEKILVDDTGASILHVAARKGVVEIVDAVLLVSKEMVKDENGWTPGMIAERFGYKELAEKLMSCEKESEETGTKSPERLSDTMKGDVLIVSENGLEVSLPRAIDCGIIPDVSPEGWPIQWTDRAYSVLANAPIPFKAEEFYFEVEVLEDLDDTGGAAIGLASLPQNLHFHLPGWTGRNRWRNIITSWGYHANNGFRCPGVKGYSEPYGAAWVTGDRIGCGWEKEGGKLWFVKNGIFQGTAYKDVKGQLYPIVGIGGGGIKLRVDFNAFPPTDRVEPVRTKNPVGISSSEDHSKEITDREFVAVSDDVGASMNNHMQAVQGIPFGPSLNF